MHQVSSKFKSTILFNAVPRKSYTPYLVYAFQGKDHKEVGFFHVKLLWFFFRNVKLQAM